MCIGVDSNKVATVTDCGRAGHWTYDKKSKLIRNINTGWFFPVKSISQNVFFSCEINFTIFCSLNHVFSKLKMLLQVYVCLLVNSMVLYVLK